MEMEKHVFKKKFGQNFLQDQSVLKRIYESITPTEKDLIIEIGPGSGNLTKWLKKYGSKILCYEIDTSLKETLSKLEDDKLQVIFNDFMESNIKEDIKEIEFNDVYIIANIPYYITTPIIKKITFSGINPKNITLMVQKEVADRLSSKPGTKEYGYITVLLNYFYNIKKLFNVSKNCFYPAPNVDSAIISLSPTDNEKINFELFDKFITDAFQFKRKNLRNNLKKYNTDTIEEVLKKYNFNLSNRAEEIPLKVYIEIVKELS